MSDPLFKDIHDLRQTKGCVRQPTHDKKLLALHAAIHPARHPYELSSTARTKLMANPWFKVGCLGLGSPAALPPSGYIYRICPIAKMASYTHGWYSSKPRKDAEASLIFHTLMTKVEGLEKAAGVKPAWLRLRSYASGRFYSPRKFSFWTGYELNPSDPAKLLACTRSLGLPDDWLDEYCVVLRCETRALRGTSLAQTPTTLDGFDSHIFHPRREAIAPPCGVTIDLSRITPLQRGQQEFAIGPIEASAIEVYPVHLPQILHPSIEARDPRLLASLRAYYKALP